MKQHSWRQLTIEVYSSIWWLRTSLSSGLCHCIIRCLFYTILNKHADTITTADSSMWGGQGLEPRRTSVASGNIYQTTRCCIPDDSNAHGHYSKNLTFLPYKVLFYQNCFVWGIVAHSECKSFISTYEIIICSITYPAWRTGYKDWSKNCRFDTSLVNENSLFF